MVSRFDRSISHREGWRVGDATFRQILWALVSFVTTKVDLARRLAITFLPPIYQFITRYSPLPSLPFPLSLFSFIYPCAKSVHAVMVKSGTERLGHWHMKPTEGRIMRLAVTSSHYKTNGPESKTMRMLRLVSSLQVTAPGAKSAVSDCILFCTVLCSNTSQVTCYRACYCNE